MCTKQQLCVLQIYSSLQSETSLLCRDSVGFMVFSWLNEKFHLPKTAVSQFLNPNNQEKKALLIHLQNGKSSKKPHLSLLPPPLTFEWDKMYLEVRSTVLC